MTRYRLRLTDPSDSRLGGLGDGYELGAASWTGRHAAFVGFYRPPAEGAGDDLARRLEAARTWAQGRLQVQGAERASVLLVALGPVDRLPPPAGEGAGPVHTGAISVDLDAGRIASLGGRPPGLPGVREVREAAAVVSRGGPVPTLAAVDLAERQTVAGGYAAPARRALVMPPYATYGLIGLCVAVFLVENAIYGHEHGGVGANYLTIGALPDAGPQSHDWWRYVSSAFIHARLGGGGLGILHILGNSLGLYFIGGRLEQLFGRLALVATFLVTAVAGSLVWVACHAVGLAGLGVAFGASGGVFGLMGLTVMLGRVQGRDVPAGLASALRQWALTLAGYNLVIGVVISGATGINNFAHVGGFATGLLVGLVLPPRAEVGGRPQRRWEQAIMAAVVLAAAVALGVAAEQLASFLSQPSLGLPGIPVP